MTLRRTNPGRGPGVRSAPRLFRLRRRGRLITELTKRPVAIEPSLQALMERHLLNLLDVHLVASEYPIGSRQKGRIDTLGIDQIGAPVVIEYKRTISANVVGQGLFYLDWLDDHRAEFRLLVQDRIGPGIAAIIRWENPRLICVAAEFHRYDIIAVRQMERSIELVQYMWFAEDILMLQRIGSGPT